MPTWAGWLGIVVGILSLGLIVFFPWFLVAIWILVVSIGMFVRASPARLRSNPAVSGPAWRARTATFGRLRYASGSTERVPGRPNASHLPFVNR